MELPRSVKERDFQSFGAIALKDLPPRDERPKRVILGSFKMAASENTCLKGTLLEMAPKSCDCHVCIKVSQNKTDR